MQYSAKDHVHNVLTQAIGQIIKYYWSMGIDGTFFSK